MRIRRLRTYAAAAAIATAFWLAAPSALAVDVGDLAPDFEGKAFINCEELSLKDLRGRLVLFELFSTG